jgi:hypothetical protein
MSREVTMLAATAPPAVEARTSAAAPAVTAAVRDRKIRAINELSLRCARILVFKITRDGTLT